MNLITLGTVKTLLNIGTTDFDTQLNLMIPIVSSDVRRILNNQFNEKVDCDITEGSNIIENIYNENALYNSLPNIRRFPNNRYLDEVDLNNGLDIGRVVVSDSFPEETYITDYDAENARATVSNTATADATQLITSVSIALFPTISKMIWFKINGMNSNAVGNEIKSKSMGIVSITFDTNINRKWNYPQNLINDLGTPLAKVN